MTPSLWFVVPAHGRHELTAVCLENLRHTCDQLEHVHASAVVVGDDDNLHTARDLGFNIYRRDNRFLSRKFNDGIQMAMDPAFNPHPVDYVVPCGSDDFVHPRLLDVLPGDREMIGFQHMSFVREDWQQLTVRELRYPGGAGIRIYPREVMRRAHYRPADEHRRRGCDTSILVNLQLAGAVQEITHRHIDPLWLVDWKSPDENLNPLSALDGRYRATQTGDPFVLLQGMYPSHLLARMQERMAVAA